METSVVRSEEINSLLSDIEVTMPGFRDKVVPIGQKVYDAQISPGSKQDNAILRADTLQSVGVYQDENLMFIATHSKRRDMTVNGKLYIASNDICYHVVFMSDPSEWRTSGIKPYVYLDERVKKVYPKFEGGEIKPSIEINDDKVIIKWCNPDGSINFSDEFELTAVKSWGFNKDVLPRIHNDLGDW